MEKRKILIKGSKVHNVGYRAFLLDEAEGLFITNFSARNIKNETEMVEVLVGGDKEMIDTFIEFVRGNFPDDAVITDISVEDYDGDIRTIEAYSRSFSTAQLSKIAITGVALVNNQKEHIEITREIVRKQDEHIGLTKEIIQKQDEHIGLTKNILQKQDEHIGLTKNILQKQDEHIGLTKNILQKQDEHIGLTKKGFNNIIAKQEEHISITKDGFNSVIQELKSFKDVHEEILELRQEIAALKDAVSRIEKMVEA